MDLQRRKGAEDAAAAHAAYRKAWMLMGGIAVLALAGGTLIARQISRSIGGSVSTAVQLARTVEASSPGNQALIDESVQEIRSGSTLAREAGATMNEIVQGIAQVSRLITDIAAASKEQAVGIEQTYGAVSELDQITQRNAALVEELAATAGALENEAAALEKVVARFQLAIRPAAIPANTRLLAA